MSRLLRVACALVVASSIVPTDAQAQLAGAPSAASQASSSVGAQTTSAMPADAPATSFSANREAPAGALTNEGLEERAPASDAGQRQTSGSLSVTVVDSTEAVLPGATVTITGPLPGTEVVAVVTNEKGEAVAEGLAPGTYRVQIELSGFEVTDLGEVAIRGRRVRKNAVLSLGKFAEEVAVTQDATDKSLNDNFTNMLTADQLDQLPDDPEEMARVLEQMAGPGAVLRVNGFEGGRLPPKDQIQQIRFRFDPYSADNHESGRPRVDITTRPGNGEWRNNANVGFRDQSLDARNAFAPERGEGRTRRARWSINGPIVKGRTSFAFTVGGTNGFDSQTIIAATPDGAYNGLVNQGSERMNVDFRLEHALTKNHALRIDFQREANDRSNLGVGDFDLPERAYTRDELDERLRVSDIGTFGRRFVNDLRFEYARDRSTSDSFSDARTIDVQNAFTSGGAQVGGGTRSWQVELFDEVEFTLARKHGMRVGVDVETGRYRSDATSNMTGTFVFASLEDYLAGRPIQFSQRVGNPLVTYTRYEAAWWVQDDFRLRKNLLLGLGLRHEVQSQLDDWNNFAPRASVTWTPFRSGKTTLRAGAGLFYDWYEASTYEETIRVDGFHQQDLIIRNPSFPDPFGAGAAVLVPPSRIQAAENLVMPTTRRVSFGIEQQVTGWARLRANVFDERTWNRFRAVNVNAPVDGVRPDPNYGRITQIESIGRAASRGFDVSTMFNYAPRQLFGMVGYRYADVKNDADGPLNLPANSLDLAAEWASARDDVRHRIFSFVNFRLPKGFGVWLNARASSGAPYNITTGFDDNADTVTNDRPEGVGRNSARGDWQSNVDLRLSWSFGQLGGGGRGGRGGASGPPGGGPQVVRLGPDGPAGAGISGSPGFEIYLQAFNVFNTVSYTSYSGVLTSPYFGDPIAALPGRRLELGMRVSF